MQIWRPKPQGFVICRVPKYILLRSVLLLWSLPNHFFKLGSLWPGSTNFLEISLVLSCSLYLTIDNSFSWKTIDLVYLTSNKTLFCFEAFWVSQGSSMGFQHFRLPLSQFLEHMNLSYLQWKRIRRAFIWHQNLKKIICKLALKLLMGLLNNFPLVY